MRTKINAVLCLVLALFMILMIALSYKAREKGLENVLLITPGQPVETPADIEKLEDRNTLDYILTYETNKAGTVSALNKDTGAVIKGTNYLYEKVMRTPLISGAFFSKAAQDEHRNLAVLNKTAAFEILGDMDASGSEIKIDGETFTVCGVIQDGDKDNNNVYVPFQTESGFTHPVAFAASLNENAATAEEEIINKVKDLSINDNMYGFHSLGDFMDTIYTKTVFSVKSAGVVFLFFCFIYGLSEAKQRIRVIQCLNEQYDLADIRRNGWFEIIRAFLGAMALIMSIVLIMALFLSGVEDFLFIIRAETAEGLEGFLNAISGETMIDIGYSPGFSFATGYINKLSMSSHFAFLGYMIALLILFVFNLMFRTVKGEGK